MYTKQTGSDISNVKTSGFYSQRLTFFTFFSLA